MSCPHSPDGIHVLGSGLRCACGYVLHIGRVSVSIDVMDGNRTLVREHFNCDSVGEAIAAMRVALDRLEAER